MRGEVSLNVWSDCSIVHKKQTQPLLRPLLSAWNTTLPEVDFLLFASLVINGYWLVAGDWSLVAGVLGGW